MLKPPNPKVPPEFGALPPNAGTLAAAAAKLNEFDGVEDPKPVDVVGANGLV